MQEFTVVKTYPNGEESLYCDMCDTLFNKMFSEEKYLDYLTIVHRQIHKKMNLDTPDLLEKA